MEVPKDPNVQKELIERLFDDMEVFVKSVNDKLPNILINSVCDTERKIIEKEFKGLI